MESDNSSTISNAVMFKKRSAMIVTYINNDFSDQDSKNLHLRIPQIVHNNHCSSHATTSAAAIAPTIPLFPCEQNKIIKRLNIGFDNLHYSTKLGFFQKETKHILNGLTGEFKSGELTAIVGPSGAGKSTCLNILAGFTCLRYSGEVLINGAQRDIKAFKSQVAFITQDTTLQPYLTVKEAMYFAANLKIGTNLPNTDKRERIKMILDALGLYENCFTCTGYLSGGQKKRLAIALELINNPPVLILDEPTSGLDSSTSTQCIALLKKLALDGRTVICTIHQPNASTFQMFDHLYAMSDGRCIYAGGTHNLLHFLKDVGMPCPEFYNPADYLMEIATDDYGVQNSTLVEKMLNGRNESYRKNKKETKDQLETMKKVDNMLVASLKTPVMAPTFTINVFPSLNQRSKSLSLIREQCLRQTSNSYKGPDNTKKIKLLWPQLYNSETIYAVSFWCQLIILLRRTLLILWRDKSLTGLRFTFNLLTAFIIGFLYYGIGNDASNALNNFRYCFYSIMFIAYTAFSSTLVKFPLELHVLSAEHFNRWYSLKAYYVAITLADLPIQVLCTSVYIIITYLLTHQPPEMFRLILFCVIVFLTGLVAQSIGLAVGASLNIKLAAVFGPFILCPFLVFSGFFLQEKDTINSLKWLFKTSFLKYSFDGAVVAIFGFDRAPLLCNDMYCHYSRPRVLLKDVDMLQANYLKAVIFLLGIFSILRVLTFYIMSFRLSLFR